MTMTELMFEAGERRLPLLVVRRAGTHRMNLRIDARQGAVRLTLPRFAPLAPAMRWVEEKRSWVEAQLAALPRPQPIAAGIQIPIGDRAYTLSWSPVFPRTPRISGEMIEVGGPPDMLNARVLRWLKRVARERLTAETFAIARSAGVSVSAVGIGDPTGRWGSCSASGAIRYSWRLILAPDFVLRATVAHEVAHRVHMNHSAAFHALVAELYGADPKPARLWLRKHAGELHGFGHE